MYSYDKIADHLFSYYEADDRETILNFFITFSRAVSPNLHMKPIAFGAPDHAFLMLSLAARLWRLNGRALERSPSRHFSNNAICCIMQQHIEKWRWRR